MGSQLIARLLVLFVVIMLVLSLVITSLPSPVIG